MFENFVTFTEVVKLSSNVFWRMKEVNYHDKLLKLIYDKEDVFTFEEVIELVENKQLIAKFANILDTCSLSTEGLWVENIFKVIDHIDISSSIDTLLIYSSKNGFTNFVKYLVERGADVSA